MVLQIQSFEYKYLATDAVRELINKNGTGRVSTLFENLAVVIDYEEWEPVRIAACTENGVAVCTENGVAVIWGDDIDICFDTLSKMIKNIIGNGRDEE